MYGKASPQWQECPHQETRSIRAELCWNPRREGSVFPFPRGLLPGGCCNHPSRLFAGSKDHREADPDGEADWKRSLRRSLDGKVAWRKGRRQGVFYHGGGQLVQRNRNLPDCPNEAWKYSRWVGLKRIIWQCADFLSVIILYLLWCDALSCVLCYLLCSATSHPALFKRSVFQGLLKHK